MPIAQRASTGSRSNGLRDVPLASQESVAPGIVAWVKQGPAGCGLDRAHWTAAALATSLYQTKGIAVSERTMRAFCTKHDVAPIALPLSISKAIRTSRNQHVRTWKP